MIEEMPLQVGTWTVNSNGVLGTLVIEDLSAAGIASGSINMQANAFPNQSATFSGYWNEESQKLEFSIIVPPPRTASPPRGGKPPPSSASGDDNPPQTIPPLAGNPTEEIMQVFVGFMFEDQLKVFPAVSGETIYTLAGYFENFGSGGTGTSRPSDGTLRLASNNPTLWARPII